MNYKLIPYIFMAITFVNIFRFWETPIEKCWEFVVVPFLIGLTMTITFDIGTFVFNRKHNTKK
jgi:hypothetical protein